MPTELELEQQADQEFASGFTDAPTETPAAVEPVVEAPVVEEAPKYVQITEDVLKQLQAGATLAETLRAAQEKQFGTVFGKFGGLERALNEIKASTPAGGIPQVTEEDFAELKANFPDLVPDHVASMNRILSRMKVSGAPAVDAEKLESLVQERLQTAKDEFTQKNQVIESKFVAMVHPDKDAIYKQPEFLSFVNTLPNKDEVLNTWDSDVLIPTLNAFKKSLVKPAVKAAPNARKEILDASTTPRGSGANAPSPSAEDEFTAGYKTG